jgi:hypothetical protein
MRSLSRSAQTAAGETATTWRSSRASRVGVLLFYLAVEPVA